MGTEHSSSLEQIAAMARRSIRRTFRQRGLLIFPMLFPLILFAINGSALKAATLIPGFPPVSYRAFALAVPFMQGALFISTTAGIDLARDIESGFFNRLSLTPLRGSALLLGQLGGAIVVAAIQSIVYLIFGLAWGVGIASGVGGACLLLVLTLLIAFGFAGLGTLVALRFGNGEAVQAFFPLFFVTLFLSSSSLPRSLMKEHWFRDIATYNPVSYLIEGIRSLIITGWNAQALELGFGFAVGLALISLSASSFAMRHRMART